MLCMYLSICLCVGVYVGLRACVQCMLVLMHWCACMYVFMCSSVRACVRGMFVFACGCLVYRYACTWGCAHACACIHY